MDCIFCKIINGDIPSYTIYEDEYVKCFLDINPIENGHTLIIPKKHFTDMNDIEDEYVLKIHEASKKIAEIVNKKLKSKGIKLEQNNGFIQDVKHYHLHLIPKYQGKKSKMSVEEVFNSITK
jgi:histidine triad (HIT) family protein